MKNYKACGFKPLDGFFAQTTECVNLTDKFIHLDKDLLELLPEYGDWTVIALHTGKLIEVVRVRNYCGYLAFDRAFEGTKKLKFSCPSYVEFIMTKAGVEAMACCSTWFENCDK